MLRQPGEQIGVKRTPDLMLNPVDVHIEKPRHDHPIQCLGFQPLRHPLDRPHCLDAARTDTHATVDVNPAIFRSQGIDHRGAEQSGGFALRRGAVQ